MNEIEILDNSQGIWWTRPTFSVMLETMSVKVSSFILIEESETRIKGWTAALYAGNMLFILGFTPGERWLFKIADKEPENLCCCLCCLLLLPQIERDLQCLFIFWKRHPMIPTCVQMNISQTGFITAIRGFKMTFCMTANFDSPTVRPPLNTLHSIWGYFSTRLWKR